MTVPYSTQRTAKYPSIGALQRHPRYPLGCLAGHPGLDTIGVQITYSDTWRTPLHNLIGLMGNGWTLVQSNQMRMEPVL